jgi:hypothetical protein
MTKEQKNLIIGTLVALAVFGSVAFFVVKAIVHKVGDVAPKVGITTTLTYEQTPIIIKSMRHIGEWEFMTITDEEVVERTRKNLILSDDKLVRIYYGTLRLGIDLEKLKDTAISIEGDSISILLPPVQLLDEAFIDEALTKTFYESGEWDNKTHNEMYAEAQSIMIRYAMNDENQEQTRQLAETQMRQLLQGLGFRHITIRFESR